MLYLFHRAARSVHDPLHCGARTDLRWIGRRVDPAAQVRAAKVQIEQMTEQTQLATSPSALTARASVIGARETGMSINHQPILDVDVTVLPAGERRSRRQSACRVCHDSSA